MQRDLTSLLEASYNNGFENIKIEFKSDNYNVVRCTFDNLYLERSGLKIMDKNHLLFIPYNNLIAVEVL